MLGVPVEALVEENEEEGAANRPAGIDRSALTVDNGRVAKRNGIPPYQDEVQVLP